MSIALTAGIEVALRVWIGGWLVLYVLRSSFGFFPGTGVPVQSVKGTAEYMERFGWRPGILWAWLSTANNLAGGAMLALGLFTRPVALVSCVLLLLSAKWLRALRVVVSVHAVFCRAWCGLFFARSPAGLEPLKGQWMLLVRYRSIMARMAASLLL